MGSLPGDIDTTGTFNLSKSAYVGYFERHGKGNIINISATLHYRGDPLQVHAGSAKAAIGTLPRHNIASSVEISN